MEAIKPIESLIQSITGETFKEAISTGTVLVDFWMDRCGFCDKLSPKLEAFAREHQDIKLVKLNKKDAEELCKEFNITVFPTMFLYKDGEFIKHCTGNRSEEQIRDFVFGDYGTKEMPKSAAERRADMLAKKEPPKTKTMQELSVVELKSLAYDQMAQLEQARMILDSLNQEISRRNELKSDS